MAKRRKPSPEYAKELVAEAYILAEKLAVAKAKLYNIVFEAKLFEPEFESARLYCIAVSDEIERNIKEQNRVGRALEKLPELPLEEN